MKKSVYFLLFTLLTFGLHAQAQETRYVSVVGQGQTQVMPDFITFNIRLSAQEKNSALAKKKVDSAMKKVMTLNDKYHIKKEHIEAMTLRSHPYYSYENNRRTALGEEVSRTAKIKLINLDDQTNFLHELIIIDNVQIEHSEVGFNNSQVAQQKATELALLDAKNKAQHMAKVLDKKIGQVLSIEEQDSQAPMPMMAMRSNAKESHTPAPQIIQPQTISAQVSVRFELQ